MSPVNLTRTKTQILPGDWDTSLPYQVRLAFLYFVWLLVDPWLPVFRTVVMCWGKGRQDM